jgi:hypothetical protein
VTKEKSIGQSVLWKFGEALGTIRQ